MFFQSRPDAERFRLQGHLESPRAAFWAATKKRGSRGQVGGGTDYFANGTREEGAPGVSFSRGHVKAIITVGRQLGWGQGDYA